MGVLGLVWLNRPVGLSVIVADRTPATGNVAPDQFVPGVTRQESALCKVVGAEGDENTPTSSCWNRA